MESVFDDWTSAHPIAANNSIQPVMARRAPRNDRASAGDHRDEDPHARDEQQPPLPADPDALTLRGNALQDEPDACRDRDDAVNHIQRRHACRVHGVVAGGDRGELGQRQADHAAHREDVSEATETRAADDPGRPHGQQPEDESDVLDGEPDLDPGESAGCQRIAPLVVGHGRRDRGEVDAGRGAQEPRGKADPAESQDLALGNVELIGHVRTPLISCCGRSAATRRTVRDRCGHREGREQGPVEKGSPRTMGVPEGHR